MGKRVVLMIVCLEGLFRPQLHNCKTVKAIVEHEEYSSSGILRFDCNFCCAVWRPG